MKNSSPKKLTPRQQDYADISAMLGAVFYDNRAAAHATFKGEGIGRFGKFTTIDMDFYRATINEDYVMRLVVRFCTEAGIKRVWLKTNDTNKQGMERLLRLLDEKLVFFGDPRCRGEHYCARPRMNSDELLENCALAVVRRRRLLALQATLR